LLWSIGVVIRLVLPAKLAPVSWEEDSVGYLYT
jgi:hypothetical protein